MKLLTAGDMRHVIYIDRFAPQQNELGESVPDWEQVAHTRARLTYVSDRERIAAGQNGVEITHRFCVRWCQAFADISTLDRIRFDGRAFDIVSVKDFGRSGGVEVTAKARAE